MLYSFLKTPTRSPVSAPVNIGGAAEKKIGISIEIWSGSAKFDFQPDTIAVFKYVSTPRTCHDIERVYLWASWATFNP